MDGLLDRGRSRVFLHVLQQDLLEAGRFIQKIRFTFGERRDLFEICPVHVLAQADGGDGDAVIRRFTRKRKAVTLLGDTVGQQHDVLIHGVLIQDSAVRLGEGGCNLRAAIGRDARDEPLDQGAIFRAAERHRPLK